MSRITREDLYALVWSKPIKNVAPQFSMSDVALAKICRKHQIPRPPRGYWARSKVGKTDRRALLPERGLGMPSVIDLSPRLRNLRRDEIRPEDIYIPPPSSFPEPIEDVAKRVGKMVGKVSVSQGLDRAHPLVKRLLDNDDERREKQRVAKYSSSLDGPLFESQYEQRRLRIVSAIFSVLSRCGAKPELRGKDPEDFSVSVGDQSLSFRLDASDVRRNGYRFGDELNRPKSLPLLLKICSWRDLDDVRLSWNDKPGAKLEKRISEVVVSLLVAGELQHRRSEIEC